MDMLLTPTGSLTEEEIQSIKCHSFLSNPDDGNTAADHDWSNLNGLNSLRTEITSQLSDVYQRGFDATRKRELVLITGPSGVGKTSLAYTLRNNVVDDNGCLVSGKFDPLEGHFQTAPTRIYSEYGALIEAFTEYVDHVSEAGVSAVGLLKQVLESNMDSTELQVLGEMIPALAIVLDAQAPVDSTSERPLILKGADAENRLVHIFNHFLRTICLLGHRIILFLDDLQWANRGVLNLLKSLLLSKDEALNSNFMLLGTCRTNELSLDHPFSSTLNDLETDGIILTEIQVSNMTKEEVNHVVSGVLKVPTSESTPLSDIVFQQTEGNLLFSIQLLMSLHEDGVIVSEAGRWRWDINKVLVAANVGSMNRLVKRKVDSLDESAQEILRIASCLGAAFPADVLTYTGVVDAEEVENVIQSLTKMGLVRVDCKSGTLRFVHDKVHQTVYELTPDSVVEELHLNIGRKLKKCMPKDVQSKYILIIAHQISLGVHLIENPTEKQEVIELFFQAGQKAALSSSFLTAAAYLNLGISLLDRRHWKEQYRLSLRMYNFAAELEYYNGNLKRVDELINVVLLRAKSFDDTLLALFTRIYSLGSRGDMQEGLRESLDVLKSLGEDFPRKPGIFRIISGLIRCKHKLHGKTDEDILSLPTMSDRKKLAAMRLMIYSVVFAFYASGEHVPLIAFRVAENTLRYGMSEMASVGFGLLGMVSAFQGNVDEACRFGQLALKIFDNHDSKEWHARLGVIVYGIILPLKHPLREMLEPLQAAHKSSLILGDVHHSVLCLSLHSSMEHLSGVPLAFVLKELRNCHNLCLKYGQHSVGSTGALTLQLVLNLMGQSRNPLILTGEVINEEEATRVAKETNPVNYIYLHALKLELAVYMNEFPMALALVGRLKRLDHQKLLPFTMAWLLFLEGLVAATSPSWSDRLFTRKRLSKIQEFAKNSPFDYMSKMYLVKAELANQAGNIDKAMTNYKFAIQVSRQNGFIQEQALASERAAYALALCQRYRESSEYMFQARRLYAEWGALAKVDQLDALGPVSSQLMEKHHSS